LKSATNDASKLKTIFGSSDANIGILCDRFWVLDIDGPQGIDDLAKLIEDNGDLPTTPKAFTGGGGRHYLFKADRRVAKSQTKIGGCSIDVKTKGGAIVAPPSLHASGSEYHWLVDPVECEIAKAPEWLIDFVCGKHSCAGSSFTVEADLDLKTHPGVEDGERNDTLCRLVGSHLGRLGDTPELLQLATDWGRRCDPPMKDNAVARTVANLVAKHLTNNPEQSVDTNIDLDLDVISFADIEAKSVAWLWEGRFALGKITLLTGDGGVGKSMLTCDMAARISNGGHFGDGAICPIGDCFFIGSEDGAEDTIRPRLDAAGANVDRIHLVRGPKPEGEEYATAFDLSRHIGKLDRMLLQFPEAKLIVIDPIMDYLGATTNSDRATDVRRVLSPLRSLAERHEVAIAALNHLNKRAGTGSKSRSLGSGAFVQVARFEFRVVEDPDDTDRRLLLPVKNNLAAAPGLAYRIESGSNGAGFAVWEEGTVDVSIGEVESDGGGEDRSAFQEAKEWLEMFLSDGAVKASEAKKKSRADGIADRTLARAKKKLSIVTEKRDRCWWWKLPKRDGDNGEDSPNNPETSFTF
tara:strand:- start:5200 stop:6936 length:1737 start_codon:yes stop_codon:yes gene_type:complete